MESIYQGYEATLHKIMDQFVNRINDFDQQYFDKTGERLYEHVIARVKSDASMREKCRRNDLPENVTSALTELHDAIGIRIICSFRNDIYRTVEWIKSLPGVSVFQEKDYVKNAKPNGYRSYHMIIQVEDETADLTGNTPGKYFMEIQLRTVAMDTWASLEHKIKYKKDIPNPDILIYELKRCADELAACDLSMQTIKELIEEDNPESK